MIRDEVRVSEKPESNEKVSFAEAFREKDVETFCQILLPIFYPFPPARPWTIPETWTDFLNELRLYFTWAQIDNIINIMLENLERDHVYSDRAPIRTILRFLAAPWNGAQNAVIGLLIRPLINLSR